MSNNLKTLISKLTDSCRGAAEKAASLCMQKGHYEVDIEHLFICLIGDSKSDVALLCKRYEVPLSRLQADLESEMSQFKTGNTRTPVFGTHLVTLLENAWLIASLDTSSYRIRSGHLLLALLSEPGLRQMALRTSAVFAKFNVEELKHKLPELAQHSAEHPVGSSQLAGEGSMIEQGRALGTNPSPSKTPALEQFTTNLTQRARDGKVDPVIGRDGEIRQVIDILMRRRQNNPILTGEAGVGKTAVVEGFAQRVAAGDVPEPLQGVEVHVLDMGLLQAGASVKGEFENRLKNVIEEVKKSPHPIILFIDEAHTMIGAGGQAGQSDAANLLKPALARGELRTIAATTWSEYKKYFEKDAALARRFQVIKVDEPSESVAAAMLRAMLPLMEKHFGIRILDEAITAAVRLSSRYISGRQLPDKAISVLDTACAKVALGQSALPAAMDDLSKRLQQLASEVQVLLRETATGTNHHEKLAHLNQQQAQWEAELDALRARYAQEKKLAAEIAGLRQNLEQKTPVTAPLSAPPVDTASTKGKKPKTKLTVQPLTPEQQDLKNKLNELEQLQQGSPLVSLQVDGLVVAEIISGWTGIPLGKMVKDDIRTVLNLSQTLRERVLGQDHALEAIAQRIRTARANIEDPNKPKGVFLFTGPSGVGKTETALALAESLYGGERKLITINMSEYQESHTVSGLKGSPPGYVGYGEGGVLTEAVRRQPYSVVLLDEIEKAHPDVLELFFQVFDKGVMDDAEGREIDFRNTVIILTSNIGSAQIMQACLNKPPEEIPNAQDLAQALRPVLFKSFKPAFLGRTKVIPYYPINDDVLTKIIRLKLDRIAQRIRDNHKARFDYDTKLIDTVLARCTEVDSGARNVDHILNGTLLPQIAEHVLARMAESQGIESIKVTATKAGDIKYSVQ